MLLHIAEHSEQHFQKYTLEDLLELQVLLPEERLQVLERELNVGISKILVLLQNMPLGFGLMGPVRLVVKDYVQDLHDLSNCSTRDEEHFKAVIHAVFDRHRGMLGKISQALVEFQRMLGSEFMPVGDLEHTNCVGLREVVDGVRRIEKSIDEFFTIRTTLRLLIAHCIKLSPDGDGGGLPGRANRGVRNVHELLAALPDDLRVLPKKGFTRDHVGAICMQTRPSMVLIEAYQHTQYMFTREFGTASPLLVNGIPASEYIKRGQQCENFEHFPYVDIHLYFVFFEVLKNALMTSLRKAGPGGRPPPIHASLISDTPLHSENERVVKISDAGEGIKRHNIRKVWSYFYSTQAEVPPRRLEDADRPNPPKGLGLPVSRMLARYFGGEIDLHSIPQIGTDVYVYL